MHNQYIFSTFQQFNLFSVLDILRMKVPALRPCEPLTRQNSVTLTDIFLASHSSLYLQ